MKRTNIATFLISLSFFTACQFQEKNDPALKAPPGEEQNEAPIDKLEQKPENNPANDQTNSPIKSPLPFTLPIERPKETTVENQFTPVEILNKSSIESVSYTHLTLPTICSV